MGWPFENPDWAEAFEKGAYYAGLGSEMLWVILSVICLVVALIMGSMHEKSAYRREEERSGK